jgi:hypothetical protein
VKIGDIVRIRDIGFSTKYWPEVYGQIGVIVAKVKRVYINAYKVMVLGEIAEFDWDELETVNESR